MLELKAAREKETLKQVLAEGHAQLHENDYVAELRAAGVEKIHAMVIAFDGKTVKVEAAKALAKKSSRKTTKKAPKATKKRA